MNPGGNIHQTTKRSTFRNFSFKIGNIFCMTPWYDFDKAELKRPGLNKLYCGVSGVVFGTLLIAAIVTNTFDPEDDNIFEKLLSTLNTAISIFLTEFLIFGSTFIKQHQWKVFLEKFSELHVFMENRFECKISVQFFLGHLVFLVTYSCHGYIFYSFLGISFILPFTSSLIPEYYCFLYVLVSSNLALAIKCMYEDLNELLKRITENHYLIHGEPSQEKLLVHRLLGISKRYRSMAQLVDYYNNIFGWATVVIFLNSIIQLLRCANLILQIMERPELISYTIIVSLLCAALLSMGESVYIIMCCELASSTGRKMRQLCYKLQENFDVRSRSRKELFKLAEIAESYKPEFTAANFFVIKKGTILRIISIATTYLIVIIQFNSKLHEKYFKDKA